MKSALHALLRCGIGVALGLGLAAFYLVPALTLQGDVLSEQLWGSYYTPGRWLFARVTQWPSPQFMAMIVSFAAAFAVLSTGVALLVRHASDPRRFETVVWALISLLCISLMAGVVPQFWTAVPFVAEVQFPWRMMALAEFAAITAFAMAIGQMPQRATTRLMVAVLVAALPGFALLAAHSAKQILSTRAYWEEFRPDADAHMPDASEYLPAGFPQTFIRNAAGLGPWTLPARAATTCESIASLCRTTMLDATGTMLVHLNSTVRTTVTVGQFYFPSWHAQTAGGASLPLQPAPPYQLLQFVAPAGVSEILLYLGRTPAEE